jgi:hypothetical protein
MDKLIRLLGASPLEFARAFGTVTIDTRIEERQQHSATLWLEGGIAPAGAGFVWGHGQLSYQGHDHAFRLSGLTIENLGTAGLSALGRVAHLRRLSDFVGTYSASAADAGASGFDPVISLKNERGVIIKLTATDAGQPFNLPVTGVRIRLKRQP